MNLHIHHHNIHHLCDEDRELLTAQNEMLASVLERLIMITPEVQALIAEAQQGNTVLASMDSAFKAMVLQIAGLQTTVNQLRAGSVMTDAEKQSIVTATSELAATVSNAQADILANTPDAGSAPAGGTPNVSGGNPAPASTPPASTDPASPPASTDPASPPASTPPASTDPASPPSAPTSGS